jgi:tetratricopeptide (TPR) repeat protein
MSARCAEGQFREILQPAVARALAEMKAGTAATQNGDAAARVTKETAPTQQGLTALEWRDKGVALLKSGRRQEALECIDKSLAIDPKDAGAWTSKAVVFTQLNRHQEVIQCCDNALAIDPKNAIPWVYKGATLILLQRHQEALECIDKSLAIDPKNADAQQLKRIISASK